MDIILETVTGYVAMELKHGIRWEKKFNRGLHRLSEKLGKDKITCFGVFMGERELMLDGITIYPALDFLKRLWRGGIIN